MHIYWLYLLNFALLGKGTKIAQNKPQIFSTKDSLVLKGFFAIFVALHHLGRQCNVFDFAGLSQNMGGVAVGMFFLLSAYGLMKSCEKNDFNYLKRMVLTKIPKLYLIQVAVNLIYFLVFMPKGTALEIILRIFNFDIFFGFDRMNSYSWFMTTILFCYVMFAFSLLLLKIFKPKNKKLFVLLVASFLILSLYFFRFSNVDWLYFRSLLCFPLGLLVFFFEPKILKLMSNKKIVASSLIFLELAFLVSCLFLNEPIPATLFCVFFVICCCHLDFSNNKLGAFFGSISLEFYLFQLIFFVIFSKHTELIPMCISVFGATIVVAFFVHKIFERLSKLLKFLQQKLIPQKT